MWFRTVGAWARLRPPGQGAGRALSRWLRLLALSFLCGFGLARCSAISEDEVLCEESVAKLRECCGPNFGGGVECYRSEANGCSAARQPYISRSLSLCLLGRSCDELRSRGSCDPETWSAKQSCSTCRDLFSSSYRCCSDWKEPSCN